MTLHDFVSREETLRTQRLLGSGPTERFAEGAPPCVVAMHGFSGTASELGPILDGVVDAGFALDAALLPGHGRRVEELQAMKFEHWADAVRTRAAAAAEKYGRFVLLGFSLGSLLALQVASEDPPGLAGLVVLGCATVLAWPSRLPMRVLDGLGMRIPDIYVMKARAADLADRRFLSNIVTYDRHPLRAALEVYRAGPRVRAVVGRVRCPTLILHGARDAVCPARNARWLSTRLGTTDVRLRVFERSAHVLAWDAERAEVTDEVTDFLARLAARSAPAPQRIPVEP